MRIGRPALLALATVCLAVAAFWVFAPREPRDVAASFDGGRLDGGVDAYLAAEESRFDDIVPGAEKRVIWAGEPGTRTDWAVVYLHGFSASAGETRPLPDRVAEGLGANLFFTRFAGHGRDGAAMAEPELSDWMADMAEAMAIGRRIGERVLILATSTGGTLATIAAADPAMREGLVGMAMISPNFRVRAPAARILTWPGVEWWGPLIAGRERGFTPANDGHARSWTTRYPTVSVLPMAASVAVARGLDFEALDVPALILLSPEDRVVDPAETRRVAARWGAGAEVVEIDVPPGNAPQHHVLAGDILSPDLTEPVAARILDWAGGL